MQWDNYKLAVFDFVECQEANVMVEAVAGSGKTKTIEEIVRRIPRAHKILVCAFSNEIRDELAKRIKGANVSVKGLNQMGHAAMCRQMNGPVEIDRSRLSTYVRRLLPGPGNVTGELRSAVTQLAKLCMSTMAVHEPEIVETMYEFGLQMKTTDLTNLLVHNTKEVLAFVQQPSKNISFEEQIFLPALLNLQTGYFDDVLVDETQDLNPAQFVIVKNALKPKGRLYAVGDRRQSIFRFRGACSNAMDLMRETFNMTVMPLSVTYRCPREVVRLAQTVVPHIEAAPGAERGWVGPATERDFLDQVQPGDVVISRTNAAITKYALKLIQQGKLVRVRGRDITSQLSKLYRQIDDAPTLTKGIELLQEIVQEETTRLQGLQKEDEATQLRDNFEALRSVAVFAKTHEKMRELIDRLGSDDKEDPNNPTLIHFMTTHKAKGLEFNRVWMFETTYGMKGEEGENLYYVAVTRAREELYLVRLPREDGKEPYAWTCEIGYTFDEDQIEPAEFADDTSGV
jgi:hypothetical protein